MKNIQFYQYILNISEDLEKGKSFLNKLKDVIVINDFENPLLHYYNFIKMQIKQLLKMKLIN